MTESTQVVLSINLRGSQKAGGEYTHYHNVNKEGHEINSIKTDVFPSFCKCKKNIVLGQPFVDMALSEPPEDLKFKIRVNKWRRIESNKRIALHVNSYVRALHPEHLGYEMSIQ